MTTKSAKETAANDDDQFDHDEKGKSVRMNGSNNVDFIDNCNNGLLMGSRESVNLVGNSNNNNNNQNEGSNVVGPDVGKGKLPSSKTPPAVFLPDPRLVGRRASADESIGVGGGGGDDRAERTERELQVSCKKT